MSALRGRATTPNTVALSRSHVVDTADLPHPPYRLPLLGDVLGINPRTPFQSALPQTRKLGPISARRIFGTEMVTTTLENTKYVASLLMLEGNYEYFKILDNNLADVMNKNITPEEAARRIEAGWNKVTNDVGRENQIKIWRKGVESGIYLDKF